MKIQYTPRNLEKYCLASSTKVRAFVSKRYCNSREEIGGLQGMLKANKVSIGYLVAQNPELY